MTTRPRPPVCGDCVHRNAGRRDTWGFCSPKGWRAWHYEPCEMGFPLDQMAIDAKGRPRP